MFSANLSTSPSLITPKTSTSTSISKPYFLSPRSLTIQSRAPDFSAASSSSSSPDWFQFPDISGPRIPRENDAVSGGNSSSRDSDDSMLNGKREKKWSRNRESYLRDDSEPLPLPMTFSDITPTSLEEIDRRLRCDPQLEDCKVPVFEWVGKCRSCQGSGYVNYYNKRGKTTCKCIPCMGVGYVQKISARKEFESMED
ncbi:protein disulfide-isomerase SCO2-like [Chenopodium quinoa]|nr:protein disulfide-isomerase SCO2-like [Chenopodium quinoa]XP_021738670.1 protein disulfide-isomerase SCO2-like [Chenopodium quinoa]XP_021738671.1 protein disulfide-isomerase SCO2-like [Chenopodium quinoa]